MGQELFGAIACAVWTAIIFGALGWWWWSSLPPSEPKPKKIRRSREWGPIDEQRLTSNLLMVLILTLAGQRSDH